MRSYCGVYRCCVTRGRRESCAECSEAPCPRLLRSLKVEEGLDGFMSHRPAPANLERIREIGTDPYLAEQGVRLVLVEELLSGWNDGRSATLYCTACALLPPVRVRDALDRLCAAWPPGRADEDPKGRARAMRKELLALAAEEGVNLALRRRR
jgi:hypothetical protein